MKNPLNAQIDELRSTLGKIEVALGSISDSIVWTDGEGKIQWCNASFDRLVGKPRISVLGKFLAEMIPLREHGVVLPRDAHPVSLILKKKTDQAGYYDFTGGEGVLSLEFMGHFVDIGSSESSAIIVLRDITRAKDLEQIRLQSAALEAAANAIVITDNLGCVTWVNGAFTGLTGYSLSEVYGKKLSLLKSGKHDDDFYRNLWETILSGKVWGGEMFNYRKDGSLYVEHQMITPVRSKGSEISHFIAIKQDISERKVAEKALLQAKNAAEAASQAKSEFLANMSHEIRTPMNSILGFTDLLLDEDLSPEQLDAVETIKHSTERLLSLINEILDLSKIESESMEIEEMSFDLKGLVMESVKFLQPRIGEKPLRLRCDLQGDSWQVVGDPLRLRQVILNLVTNAIKFTVKGEIVIAVRAVEKETDVISVAFAVSDTGIGIAEDKLETIFEVFSQADGSTTRKYGGTGLGLALSQRLTGLMGGRITVESRPGSGSTFRFNLCLKKGIVGDTQEDSPLSPGKVQADVAGRSTEPTAGAGLEILLAEDDLANQKMTTVMLKKMGHVVTLAGNGVEAVTLAQSRDYDIILMDMQMPEMDGIEARQRLRKAGLAIPIVAMTASAMKGDRERFLEAGLDDYIAKPIDRDALRTVLDRYGRDGVIKASTDSSGSSRIQSIAEELGIEESDYREILFDFIRGKREDMEDLKGAIARGKVGEVQLLAHKIKGSALNLRLDAMAAPAAHIEEAAAGGDLSRINDDMEELLSAFYLLEKTEGSPT